MERIEEFLIVYKADTTAFDDIERAAEDVRNGVDEMATAQKKSFDRAAISAKNLSSEVGELAQAQRDANEIGQLSAKILANEAGSYNALKAELELVEIAQKRLNKEQLESNDVGKQLLARQKELTKQLKEWEKASGQVADTTGKIKDSSEDAGDGVGGLSGRFKALLRNPIVALIAAVVAGLSVLGKAFSKSERGAVLMDKATAALDGTMSALTEVTNRAAIGFEELFSNGIREGLSEIGETIKTNILNRIESIPLGLEAIGKSITSLLKGDFGGAKEAAEDAGRAIVQGITGLDNDDQNAVLELLEDTANRAIDLTDKYEKLAVDTRRLRLENVALEKSLSQYIEAEQLAQLAASDSTLGFQAQQKAINDLEEAQRGRLETERRIAQNNLSLITREINIRKSAGEEVTDLYEAQAQALRAFQDVERELTVSVAENARERRMVRRDEFERELDFAVDFYDSQKTILERQANDSENSIEQRAAALERLKELDKSAFDEQLKLLEDFTGKKLDLQELSLEQDERVVRERLRQADLDDVTLGRILEVLRDRKAAVQDIADAERDLSIARSEAAAKEEDERRALIDGLRERAVTDFEARQDLEAARFELTRRSATERARFELEQEKEKLQKILELNKQFNDGLTDVQIQAIEAQIQGIDNNLKEFDTVIERVKQQIFDGLGFTPEQAKAVFGSFQDSFQQIFESRQQLIEAEIEAQSRLLDAVQERIDEQTDLLDKEFELKKLGLANNYDAERENLAALQAERARAQKEREQLEAKAAKRQAALDTAQQIGSLITASANIFKATSGIIPPIGQILAGAAITAMFTAFAATKINAKKAAQVREFGEGGEIGEAFSGKVKGAKHNPSGQQQNGVPAFTRQGKPLLLEGDEMVLRASSARPNIGFFKKANEGAYNGIDLERMVNIGSMLDGGKIGHLPPSEVPDILGNAVSRANKVEKKFMKTKAEIERENGIENLSMSFERLEGRMASIEKAIIEKPERVPITEHGYIEFIKDGNKQVKKTVRPKA